MSTILLTRSARAAFVIDQYIRNGHVPKAALQNMLAERADQAAYLRGKQVFRTPGHLDSIPASAGAGPRYRWPVAWHSGAYISTVAVYMLLAKQDNSGTSDCVGALQVYTIDACDPDVDDPIGIARVRYGNAGGLATSDVPSEFGDGLALLVDPANEDNEPVTLSPDTEYVAYFADYNDARLISAVLFELSLPPDTGYGYAPVSTPAQAPILDTDRSAPLEMARAIWKSCGTPVFHWCAETEALAPTQASGSVSGSLSETIGEIGVSATGGGGGGVLDESIGNIGISATGITNATLSFVATVTPDPIAHLGTLSGVITITVGVADQTNLSSAFYIRDSSGNLVTLNGAPTTDVAAGFTVSWANVGDGQYACLLERTSAPIGSYAVQFHCTPYKGTHTDVGADIISGSSTEVPSAAVLTDDYATFS